MDAPTVAVALSENRVGGSRHIYALPMPGRVARMRELTGSAG
jgi:hypothetical protein